MPDSAPALKVLSVVGAGRSGTTVLASILSEVDGFASPGELRWLWKRGIEEQRPCGCGEIPERCPVWAPVIDQTLRESGLPRSAAHEIVLAQDELKHFRHRVRVVGSAGTPRGDWPALQLVRSVTGAACRAFAETTGARVVIDTSKRSDDAAVIAALDGVDHYVLHVVRDPRAVVHSWRRKKSFDVHGETRSIGTRRLPSTVRRWVASSLSAELLRRQIPTDRWLRLRYEDFARDPRSAMAEILALLGEQDSAMPFESPDTVRLHPNHLVAGNPSRFTVGSVQIRADDEWREQMPRHEQRLISLATRPLMLKYGYGG